MASVGYETNEGTFCVECLDSMQRRERDRLLHDPDLETEVIEQDSLRPFPLYCSRCDRWLRTDPFAFDEKMRKHRLHLKTRRSVHPKLRYLNTIVEDDPVRIYVDQHDLTWSEWHDADDPMYCWCCMWPLRQDGYAPTIDRDTAGRFDESEHGAGRWVRGRMMAYNLSNVSNLCDRCVEIIESVEEQPRNSPHPLPLPPTTN